MEIFNLNLRLPFEGSVMAQQALECYLCDAIAIISYHYLNKTICDHCCWRIADEGGW